MTGRMRREEACDEPDEELGKCGGALDQGQTDRLDEEFEDSWDA